MSLAIILLIAIAIPVIAVFYAFAVESQHPDRNTPEWRAIRRAGSALVFAQAAFFLGVGAGSLILTIRVGREFLMSGLALSCYFLLRGIRDAFLWWAPPKTETAMKIFGAGHLIVAALLVVAAFRESLWNLLFAGLAVSAGIIYLRGTSH